MFTINPFSGLSGFISPPANASTICRASSSVYCTGGDFMKYADGPGMAPEIPLDQQRPADFVFDQLVAGAVVDPLGTTGDPGDRSRSAAE